MLPFLRADLAQLTAYTPHPEATAAPPPDLDRLDTNECPVDLPADLKQKLAWTYETLIEANRYPDGGHDLLKSAIAEYVNESVPVTAAFTPAHISVGNGSDELIRSLLIATCVGGQGAVLVANPTFSMYGILAQTLGIPVISVGRRETDWQMDLDAAQAAIAQESTPPIRVVFVVHPNSPTANTLTQAEQEWLQSLPSDILVVVDEAYFEFSQTTLAAQVHQRPNWVILRTFSKAFRLAAHRVGYAIAQPQLAAVLDKVRLPYNLPAFSQVAAQTALEHREALFEIIPTLLSERDLLLDALAQMPALQVWPSMANFIYLRTRPTIHTETLWQTLKAVGTSVRCTGGGIRLTVGTPAENQRTLARLQDILAQPPFQQ